MIYRVAFSPKALDQLIALNSYIADAASPRVADRYTDSIVEFCFSLANFPERGTRRDDISPGLRVTSYRKRMTIAFVVDARNKRAFILGVFYAGQDYESGMADLTEDES